MSYSGNDTFKDCGGQEMTGWGSEQTAYAMETPEEDEEDE